MHTSQNGLDLIKSFEGLRLSAYKDVVGVVTIGYGTTSGVKMGDTITKERAEELLREDVKRFEQQVQRLVKVPLTQGQFDALVSFVYNLGAGNLSNSTLLRLLNAGDYAGAGAQFERWNKAGGKVLAGLVRRRAAERALFEGA
ncbi:lysozyme [Stutzerimonas frequens]|uniref:lysozyme n=1 Tax=Stutzerimonas frequens TaxID=2968969 RepID=UPI0019095E23|nr:lysozyme [Stutzerimonas frequens]MBK3870977.1 glycoside hydrolase family protein [Stutzerimonas frequens]MBK3909314.1 glycoside hydrolase family protein [Stutzerimonas frequens]